MDNPRSNLGWRIILGNYYQEGFIDILKDAIRKGKHITEFINEDVRRIHSKVIDIFTRLRNGEELNENDDIEILTKLGFSLDEIRNRLNDDRDKIENAMSGSIDQPRILCTTFEGSKGLAAQYVFILGFNADHFPRRTPPKDIEIFRLIVALTRARRRAYEFTYGNFGGKKLKDSIFFKLFGWLAIKKDLC